MVSGSSSGAGDIAFADIATAKAKATLIIIVSSPCDPSPPSGGCSIPGISLSPKAADSLFKHGRPRRAEGPRFSPRSLLGRPISDGPLTERHHRAQASVVETSQRMREI